MFSRARRSVAWRLRAALFRVEEQLRYPRVANISLTHRADATVEWILRAQQATPDDGVAESYHLLTGRWNASYPETTGYLIGSLLHAADLGIMATEIQDSVCRMGRWLVATQLSCGAFPGGNVDRAAPKPAVFNTGQILLGLTELIRRGLDHDGQLTAAAQQAADWMRSVQDTDGCWRKGDSDLLTQAIHAYNARAAWGLARFGVVMGDREAVEAAHRNANWVRSVQHDDGWFEYMNFNLGELPLLHTIVYTIRGLLEIGALAHDDRCIQSAQTAARRVLQHQSESGAFPGQFAQGYQPAVEWTNLTANCQMAVACYRLSAICKDETWCDHARKALRFCCGFQEIGHSDAGRRGALRGSYPGHVGYGRHWYMNWTQKFFLDALLSELGVVIDDC